MSKLDVVVTDALKEQFVTSGLMDKHKSMVMLTVQDLACNGVYLPEQAAARMHLISECIIRAAEVVRKEEP